jgi:hypothetical protein
MSLFSWFKKQIHSSASKPSRPPRAHLAVEALESRLVPYSVSGSLWPHPELVTISFMPDGTSVNGHTSNLFSTFNTKFGSATTWENQVLKAAQQWAQQTNLNFALVSDSGAPSGSGSYQQGDATFGDIRIGGYNFGTSTLAQAYLPPAANNYSVAGDIQFNTGLSYNIGSTYDLFTVALHEFGHALGLYHSTTSGTVMYSTYTSAMNGLVADDSNGIRNIYSNNAARSPDSYDAAASNDTSGTASVITSAIDATTLAGVVNNVDLTTSTDVDWYKFVVPTGSSSTLKIQMQSQGLSLLDPKLEVYDGSLTLKASVNGNAYGTTITATVTGISAGQTYYVKASSADPIAAFRTGKYALVLNMGTGTNPTATLPNTQLANGNPLQSGGGQAIALTPSDKLINTTTSGMQQTALSGQHAVAVDLLGNYVVTWASAGQDGSGWGIYAQRYTSNGIALGSEFRVNTTTAGDQVNPTVAMDALGNFVIAWASNGQDGSGWGIYAKHYNVTGLALGGEFRVNTTTAGDQTAPAVGMNPLTGDFIITWSSYGQDSSTGDYELTFQAADLPVAVNTTPTVLSSNPGPGGVLDHAPSVIRIDYSAPLDTSVIDLSSTQLIFSPTSDLADLNAQPVALGSYNFSTTAIELQLLPAAPLKPGYYGVFLADGSNVPVLSFQVAGIEGETTADDSPSTAHALGDLTSAGLVQVTGTIGNDPSDDPSSANPLLSNPAADVDLYHFQITGPGRYAFGAEVFAGRVGARLDPGVSLYQWNPATQQLDFIDGNDNTLNNTPSSNGMVPLYNDAALSAGLTAGDYYVAVSGGGNTPERALNALPGQNGIFDPNRSHSGMNGFTTGDYVLNLTVQSDNEPPRIVAVTPADGTTLDAPPTQLTVQFSESMNLQALAFHAFQQTSQDTVSPVFVEGADGIKYYPRLESYDDATHQAQFLMLDRLPQGNYQLHLSGPLGLGDLAGNPLVGNDPSGDYVVTSLVKGSVQGTSGNPLLRVDQEPNDSLFGPQVLGVLFPHELQTGVTVTRDFTADPATALADRADYYQFQVLQNKTYAFVLNGAGVPPGVGLSL